MAELQPLPRDNQKQDMDLRMQQLEERKRYDELTLEEQRQLEKQFQGQQLELQSLQQRQRRLINQPGSSTGVSGQGKKRRLQREHRGQQLDFKIQQRIRGFSETGR